MRIFEACAREGREDVEIRLSLCVFVQHLAQGAPGGCYDENDKS